MSEVPPTPPPSDNPPPPPEGAVPGAAPGTPPPVQPVDYAGVNPGAYPAPYAGPAPTQEDKTMGLLAHVLGIFTYFIGPLIIWLVKKDQSPFVNDQGKEALNWQITMTIIAFIGALTACIGIGVVIIPAVSILNIVFCIMAAVEVNKGVAYRYPFVVRLIK
jgi:uncharacterized Tic20 family protein